GRDRADPRAGAHAGDAGGVSRAEMGLRPASVSRSGGGGAAGGGVQAGDLEGGSRGGGRGGGAAGGRRGAPERRAEAAGAAARPCNLKEVHVATIPGRMGERERWWWRTAQAVGLALTVVLLTGLWAAPQPTLRVLWYAVIPLLPAVFLVQPGLWRNVCPLATLSTLPGRRTRGLKLDARALRWAAPAGVALLALL